MGCCGTSNISKCSPEYTKVLKRLQNRIKTLISLKGGSHKGLEKALLDISYFESCPEQKVVKNIQYYIDNEYTEYYK